MAGLGLLFLTAFIVAVMIQSLLYASEVNGIQIHLYDEQFRRMDFGDDIDNIVKDLGSEQDFGCRATVCMSASNYNYIKLSSKKFQRVYDYLVKNQYDDYYESCKIYNDIYDSLEFFPVAESSIRKDKISYEDSFLTERTFGGNRQHEGTDIMPEHNNAGVYPVISVSDGVVENVGWLTLGGYRIGIRSTEGIYFYYAHLSDYACDYQIGDTVRAGEILGLMGDSGYGKEGTTGQFDVHLHFGIYVNDKNGNEISVNPYSFLRYLENRKRVYAY